MWICLTFLLRCTILACRANIVDWNVKDVTTMNELFFLNVNQNADFNEDIGQWCTKSVEDFVSQVLSSTYRMTGLPALKQDLAFTNLLFLRSGDITLHNPTNVHVCVPSYLILLLLFLDLTVWYVLRCQNIQPKHW
jgi:hypothetical protein